jgi:hypothetical protein
MAPRTRSRPCRGRGGFLFLALLAFGTGCRSGPRYWTTSQVSAWHGGYYGEKPRVLYQGSDGRYHHFLARTSDSMTWFKVEKFEIALKDERPYDRNVPALGHYYVDPGNGYSKVGDYTPSPAGGAWGD